MAEPRAAPDGALGFLETRGLVAAIEAADAMLKASEVRLLQQERTNPALITHVVTGETAAVRAAVEAGAAAAERVGVVVSKLVIPRPGDGLLAMLKPPPRPAGDADGDADGDAAGDAGPSDDAADDYDDQTVRELRALARDRDDDAFSGRTIARATKDELVAFLRSDDGAGP